MTAKERIVTLHPPYSEIRPTEIPEHEAPAYEKALSIPDMLETFPSRLYLSGINAVSYTHLGSSFAYRFSGYSENKYT